MRFPSVVPTPGDEAEEVELALARLEWVRAAGCLHLPSQRAAWQWHLAQCVEARQIDDEAITADET